MRPQRNSGGQNGIEISNITHVVFCGKNGQAFEAIGHALGKRGISVERVSTISSLWVSSLCLDSGTIAVFVDVDSLGGAGPVVERLLLFRKDLPQVPTILLSTEFASDDLSAERLPICDCSFKTKNLPALWDLALLTAFSNNSVWIDRQKQLHSKEECVDLKLTVGLLMAMLAGIAAGLYALLALNSWVYAIVAYICAGQVALVSILFLPKVRPYTLNWFPGFYFRSGFVWGNSDAKALKSINPPEI